MQLIIDLFFISVATLTCEILLLRVLSVTVWNQFVFMAISIAMFGMTVGALIDYLSPKLFSLEKTKIQLTRNAFLFSVTLIFTLLSHFVIPVMD